MDIYLVGGAVRDQLLQRPIQDRDWLVVGATPEQLIAQGYQQVGKDFPVFLHPETKEEYALARTERKSGEGYHGFICDFAPHISLEEDLKRRDLTINAIAQDLSGNIYDPYQGVADLQAKILRHVSPAFAEDPLRVLRVARFAARFYQYGFRIAKETLDLMQQICARGEIASLSVERVWLETEKALTEANPEIYFETLKQVGALATFFPELIALDGIINPVQHHPEVDSFVHTMLVLQQAVLLTSQSETTQSENKQSENKIAVRFASLCHDLGKALTPKSILPHHYGHEQKGIQPVRQLCKRLKVSTQLQELAELSCEFHTHIHKAFELRADTWLKLFNRFDVWRKPQRFQQFLLVCEADSRGRLGFEQRHYPQAKFAWQLYLAANAVNVQEIIAAGFEKQDIRTQLNYQRTLVIQKSIKQIRPQLLAEQPQ